MVRSPGERDSRNNLGRNDQAGSIGVDGTLLLQQISLSLDSVNDDGVTRPQLEIYDGWMPEFLAHFAMDIKCIVSLIGPVSVAKSHWKVLQGYFEAAIVSVWPTSGRAPAGLGGKRLDPAESFCRTMASTPRTTHPAKSNPGDTLMPGDCSRDMIWGLRQISEKQSEALLVSEESVLKQVIS